MNIRNFRKVMVVLILSCVFADIGSAKVCSVSVNGTTAESNGIPFEIYGGIHFYKSGTYSSGPLEDAIYNLFPHRNFPEMAGMKGHLTKTARKILKDSDMKYLGIENANRRRSGRTIRIVNYDQDSNLMTVLVPAVFSKKKSQGFIDSKTLWLEATVSYTGNQYGNFKNFGLSNDGNFYLKSYRLTNNFRENPPFSISDLRLSNLIAHFGRTVTNMNSIKTFLINQGVDIKNGFLESNIQYTENFNTQITDWKTVRGGLSVKFKTSYLIATVNEPNRFIEIWGRLFIPEDKVSLKNNDNLNPAGISLREGGPVRVYSEIRELVGQ